MADYDDVGYVVASTYRQIVMKRLAARPAIPSKIAEDTDVKIAHVSRALQELREKDLVELLVPEDRKKGRIYGLTEKGEGVVETYPDLRAAADGGGGS